MSNLLPSPRAGNPRSRPNQKGGKILAEEVKKSLLPTPTQQDSRIEPKNIGGSKHRAERGSVALADVALGLTKMLPTVASTDWKGRSQFAKYNNPHRVSDVVAKTGGQLNPNWVEWLMGFPIGWTDLNASETP